ncbi:MAG: magnesium and cobalt transport protein CorA [Armatimonadetes bacterium CG2_30_66_41]|nr:MAG: magnesium and cobalt transport protein CorA [Armatimonadetes bacterium CG2_30_66_41]
MSRRHHPAKKHPRRRRANIQPGAVPGLVVADPQSPPPVVTVLAYGPDGYEEKRLEQPAEVRDFLGKWPATWVCVDGLGDAEVILELGRLFGLHPLALEDVVNSGHRPKLEEYVDHVFLIAPMAPYGDQTATEQLNLFLGSNFVLTFQEYPGDCLGPVRERIRKGAGRVRHEGPDHLAYALLDALIDGYFPVLEDYGERLELLEDEIILHPDDEMVSHIQDTKRELLGLRRALFPLREAINALMRDDTQFVSDSTRVYLRDCYDHAIQVLDLIENDRELASGLMDIYLSSLSNRMNEVMKVLTLIATIFIPLTFIAGVYGMNFNPSTSPLNMPELNWKWGYPFCLALMAGTAGALLVAFRKIGWLGSKRRRSLQKGPER